MTDTFTLSITQAIPLSPLLLCVNNGHGPPIFNYPQQAASKKPAQHFYLSLHLCMHHIYCKLSSQVVKPTKLSTNNWQPILPLPVLSPAYAVCSTSAC
jgi:hypothetical protein